MGFLGRLFGRPSPNDFAKIFKKALQDSGCQEQLDFDPEQEILTQKDSARFLNLGRARDEYIAAPRNEKSDVLAKWVRQWSASEKDLPETLSDAQDKFLPRIRERAYYSLLQLQMEHAGREVPPSLFRPIAGHLAVELVVDLPEMIMMVSQGMLEDWKVDFDAALQIGIDNLWERSGEDFECLAPGLYRSPWKDNHDASRLYLQDLIAGMKVKGHHVAVVPNRDTLIVTGSEDVAGLTGLVELATAAAEEPRFMTAQPVLLKDGKWEAFLPEFGQPAYSSLKSLAVQSIASHYEEQKELLEGKFKKNGKEIFVAPFSLFKKAEGPVLSTYTVWTKGAESLLPEGENIFFVDLDRPKDKHVLGMAPLARVIAVTDALVKPMGLYPERYHVTNFPSPGQLRTIDLEAIDSK